MKKLPLVLSAIIGFFLMLCIFQAWTWPAKEISGWQPEWWQIEPLAAFGYWLAAPSIHLLLGTSHFTKGNVFLEVFVVFTPLALITLAAVISVYFLTRATVYLFYKRTASAEPAHPANPRNAGG